MRAALGWLLPALGACAAGSRLTIAPTTETPAPVSTVATIITPDRREAARAAQRAGLMPLAATGVEVFSALHPTLDGRGVLIAILDSGIDPSVDGLQLTSEGRRKVLSLRDFSGEGRVDLQAAIFKGDSVGLSGVMLVGRSRLAAFAAGQVYAGIVPEVRFGKGPGADLNGNGMVGDTLPILVARGTGGWFALIDANLNGSITDDRPLEDFDRNGTWSGWSADSTIPPRTAVAASLGEQNGHPTLDLMADVDGHGTHVAGIAAGRSLYGVDGFDGVAPGAQLLGLKIAADGLGGVTTTGSMVEAIAFAVSEAKRRSLPLVLNLSFGVGNQREGTSVLDTFVDSVLHANPDLVVTVAAGNDGPGLSTLGFPASAREVLSVGATSPLLFTGMGPGSPNPDPVAHYSSRGGEIMGPKLVAPGTAWSTVPRFNAGQEELSGTSMAAPYVAGLAARLISAERNAMRPIQRGRIMQALIATARPIPFASVLDQGAGVPNLTAAWQHLSASAAVPTIVATTSGDSGSNGIWFDGSILPESFEVRVRRTDGGGPLRIRLRSNAPWLEVIGAPVVVLPPEGRTIVVHVEPGSHVMPGVRIGALSIEDADDEGLGALLRIPVTIRRPIPLDAGTQQTLALQAGEVGREVFDADSGRGLEVTVETLSRTSIVLASLHEDGGRPVRDRTLTPAGFQEKKGVIRIPGNDVQRTRYEIALVASPTSGVATRIHPRQASVHLSLARTNGDVVVAATCMVAAPCPVDLRAEWIGATTERRTREASATLLAIPLGIPAWASRIRIDVSIPDSVWSHLTDLGVVVRDRARRIVAESPMTYPFGRLKIDSLGGVRGDTVQLLLAPASVYRSPGVSWSAAILIHYLDAAPIRAQFSDPSRFFLTPGERRTVRLQANAASRTVDSELRPLLRVVTKDADGTEWTTELTLPPEKGSTQ